MTNLLLFLILASILGILSLLRLILDEMRRKNDFSKEDASVKASTEEVQKAKERLPK